MPRTRTRAGKVDMGHRDLREGVVVAERYRVIRLLAQGGMGRVYEAEQLSLRRSVALKVMSRPRDEAVHEEFRRRFEREAGILSRLKTPHAVAVYDYGEHDGLYFIAMELVTGVPLRRCIDESAPFDPARAVGLAMQIAEALAEAHRRGIVHRDLKPSNVLVSQQGLDEHVKVIDFGIGKYLSEPDLDVTSLGVVLGSPEYMAPEQFVRSTADPRIDVYALGLCLYEMLSGQRPFRLRSSRPPIPLPYSFTQVPLLRHVTPTPVLPALESLVAACLHREPDDRPQSMQDVLGALRALKLEPAPVAETLPHEDEPTKVVTFLWKRDQTGEVQSVVARSSSPPAGEARPLSAQVLSLVPALWRAHAPLVSLGLVVFAGVFLLTAALLVGQRAAADREPAALAPPPMPAAAPRPSAPPSEPRAPAGVVPPAAAPAPDAPSPPPPPSSAQPEASTEAERSPAPLALFELDSHPPGADVVVEGAVIGRTPLSYATGRRDDVVFGFRLPGHESVEVHEQATRGGTVDVTVILPPRAAAVEPRRSPPAGSARRAPPPSPRRVVRRAIPETQPYRDDPYAE